MLQIELPIRVREGDCRVWTYGDEAGSIVGFGSLEFCRDHAQYAEGRMHAYIPVLAVSPSHQKRGHGRTIVEHLASKAEAAVRERADLAEGLFLDVYVANRGAIDLYERCGFVVLNPFQAALDPAENNAPYFVMAKQLDASPRLLVQTPHKR